MMGISMNTPDLKFHPVAEIFPMIEGVEFDKMVEDIARNGVITPIGLYEGKILDGRNRYLAAKKAGVKCPTQEWSGDDPVAYVLSLNLHRRQLTESQRASVAAKIANLELGDNQHKRQGRSIDRPSATVSQQQAAKLMSVGEASVRRAKRVLTHGSPELVKAVESGQVSVFHAAKMCGPRKEQQAATKSEPMAIPTSDARPSKAILYSDEAINCLIRIPKNDPRRSEGFRRVTDWIKSNK